MDNPHPKHSRPGIRGTRVQDIVVRHRSTYGAQFTEHDWARVADRLSALGQLLWRIALRQAANPDAADSTVSPASTRRNDE